MGSTLVECFNALNLLIFIVFSLGMLIAFRLVLCINMMRCNVKSLLFLFLLSLTTSFSAFADDKEPLVSQMDAYLIEVNKDGDEVLKPADTVYPKDKIEYKLTYTNNSKGALDGLVITGPIPQNTVYVGDTDKTKVKSKFVVSIDGGKTFEPEPVKREVMKDGKKVEVIIPPEKYTAVRWIPEVPINSKEKQIFTYRIEVK